MRIVALFSLATGALIDLATGPLELGEQSLWRRLWQTLKRGDIALSDRGFCSFAELFLLARRSIDVIARKNACRTTGSRRLKRLGKGYWLVEWTRDKHCPLWLSWKFKKEMPKTMKLREITFSVDIPGFRTRSVTVVTILLDPKSYPANRFPELYRRRWEAQLRLRDLKTSLGMEVLSTRSPEMVEREVAMYWIAYNLLRGLMVEAGLKYGCDPVRLSFMGTAGLVRQWAPKLSRVEEGELEKLRGCILEYIGKQKLRSRPDRTEPRALKRRPKTYARLNTPSRQYLEIPHRNRYKKQSVTSTRDGT